MKKAAAAIIVIALFLTCFLPAASAAPASMTQSQKDFIARVGALANADMQRSGVLASLTLAQAILESGWGTSELAVNANALFGIKADSRWSGKTYSKASPEWNGVMTVTVVASFRAYGSWEQSVADHSDFLRASTRYAAVINEKAYKKACTAIHQAGYATAPDYADRLINLIETYGLTAYDGAGSPSASTPAGNTTAGGTTTASKPAASTALLTANQRKLITALLKRLLRR
ncbi:MAG: glycoside hydrolase family 73 protein [Firmicutes bacterium]|nr:glycoside hydrolase family 73 protein [Bacillota bacterium]